MYRSTDRGAIPRTFVVHLVLCLLPCLLLLPPPPSRSCSQDCHSVKTTPRACVCFFALLCVSPVSQHRRAQERGNPALKGESVHQPSVVNVGCCCCCCCYSIHKFNILGLHHPPAYPFACGPDVHPCLMPHASCLTLLSFLVVVVVVTVVAGGATPRGQHPVALREGLQAMRRPRRVQP